MNATEALRLLASELEGRANAMQALCGGNPDPLDRQRRQGYIDGIKHTAHRARVHAVAIERGAPVTDTADYPEDTASRHWPGP